MEDMSEKGVKNEDTNGKVIKERRGGEGHERL